MQTSPAVVTLAPERSASPNPREANVVRALTAARLEVLGLQGTVKRRGRNVVVRLPAGLGEHQADELLLPEVRFRPVTGVVDRYAGESSNDMRAALHACQSSAYFLSNEVGPTARVDDVPEACIAADSDDAEPTDRRYVLGRAALGGRDVAWVRSDRDDKNELMVVVGLTHAGKEKLNAVADELDGLPEPLDELAVVFDGRVLAAPALRDIGFGRTIDITQDGGYPQEKADALVHALVFGGPPFTSYRVARVEEARPRTVPATVGGNRPV